MLIDLIAGARANFMKIAPIIRARKARKAAGGPLRYRLAHTGQHYDAQLSGDFFYPARHSRTRPAHPRTAKTLRDTTERPETVTIGTNELIGANPAHLAPALARLMAGQWKQGGIPELWDGQAAERIVAALEKRLCA